MCIEFNHSNFDFFLFSLYTYMPDQHWNRLKLMDESKDELVRGEARAADAFGEMVRNFVVNGEPPKGTKWSWEAAVKNHLPSYVEFQSNADAIEEDGDAFFSQKEASLWEEFAEKLDWVRKTGRLKNTPVPPSPGAAHLLESTTEKPSSKPAARMVETPATLPQGEKGKDKGMRVSFIGHIFVCVF